MWDNDKPHKIKSIIIVIMITFLWGLSSHVLATTAEIYYSMGKGYVEKSKYDMAALAFEKAVEASPDWPEAHNALGEAYVQLFRFQDALDQFSKAIELKPDYTEAKINHRRTMMSAERYKPVEGSRLNSWQKFTILGLLTVVIAVVAALTIYFYTE
jgi:tetratricopeptide (TPR) repeat protein